MSDTGAPRAGRRLSLRSRLILLVLATIVPLTAFTVVRRWIDYNDDLAAAGQKTLELARSLAIAIEKDIEGRISTLEVLAQSNALAEARFERFRERAESVIREQFPGSHILVLQADGQQVMNTRLPPDEAVLPRRKATASIRKVMETGAPVVSEVFVGVTAGRPLVSIDVPVKRPDGFIPYILSLNPPVDAFGQTIARLHLPEGWVATIYDQNGTIVSRNIDPAKHVGEPALPGLLATLRSGNEGVSRKVSREGVPLLAALARIPRTGWSVMLGVPIEAITGPAIDEVVRTLAEATVVLLLGLALALLLARQVTRPMAALRSLAAAGATDPDRVLAATSTGLDEADDVVTALQDAERRRRESERQRQQAERFAQRIFETSQDLIFVTDSYGTLREVSPSVRAMLGYDPAEVIGRSGREFIHPADLDATRAEISAARRGRAIRNYRSRYLHRDGHVVPIEWMAVWSAADHSYFFVGRDMTEVDRREAELRQAQKMEAVGQLTGGVAHDFNNILMVIQANVEALEDEPALAPEVAPELRKRIDGIGRAAGRAAGLTRQLLAFSRKQTLSPRLTDLNELIAETARLLARTLGARIEIGLELAADAWPVEIDRGQLDAALVNLALNARDAMPSGGKLTFATRNATRTEAEASAGDYVVLSVTDTGIGMPPEIRDKVFEPFFTTKEFGRGTGLGLSMVYGFIRQSRGHVEIESAPGEGTTFRLWLPRSVAEGEIAADPGARAGEQGGPERILVVEDDDLVRSGIVTLLQSLGYVALEAADAAQGLAVLEAAGRDGAAPVDLVLTDIVMPGAMTGRGLAEEVARRFPGVRLVFITGYSELGQQGAPTQPFGPDARLLLKPFRKADLARVLREALEA